MTISPPGGLPYHPNELGNCRNFDEEMIVTRTGLVGVWVLLLCAFWSVLMLIVSLPLLLLGVMEVVAVDPTNYRVRWIRKDPS